MPLFDIVRTVMDSNGWPAITSAVASSQDDNMRQAMALANKSLHSISYKQDWPMLIREYQFDIVSQQIAYPVPADFHHLVSPSAVNSDLYYQLKGSMTPLQWFRKSLSGAIDYGQGFRLDYFGRQFMIAPIPSSPVTLVCMYVSNNLVQTGPGLWSNTFAQDTDIALVDEDLIELDLAWRWREKKGLDYTAEMAELAGTVSTRFAQYLNYGELPIGAVDAFMHPPITWGALPPVIGV
jgi:hypothetical protein